MQETDLIYHTRRARAELDLAYSSFSSAVINAHLKMASLHLAKLREINLKRGAAALNPSEVVSAPEPVA